MAVPVFIVGSPRSGTTYLGNLLASHEEVAAAQKNVAGKFSLQESWYFSKFAGYCGDISNPDNLWSFLELFSKTDFFKETGVEISWLLKAEPINYGHLFRLMMDKMAILSGSHVFLEKTPAHAFHLHEIQKCCPDARIIILKRNIVDQVNSIFNLPRHLAPDVYQEQNRPLFRQLLLFKRVVNHVATCRYVDEFASQYPDSVLKVRFHRLVNEPEQTLSEICRFIGIEFKESMIEQDQPVTSSFATTSARMRFFSTMEIRQIKALSRWLESLPFPVIRAWYTSKYRITQKQVPRWMAPLREAYMDYGEQ